MAQGDLVFLHIVAKSQGPAPASAGGAPAAAAPPVTANPGGMVADGKGPDEMMMILRVKDGMIVDHWDMHIPTNSNSVVFADLDRKLP